ncbi:MAG: hypothetical protein AAF602_23030 [Myxococcota bacterium]
MNWKWIGLFSLTGLVMGLATSLVGLSPSVEPIVWTAFYALWGVIIVRERLSPVVTPLIAGVGTGVLTGLTQFALWDSYVASNPWYADQMTDEVGLGAILGFAIVMGAIWGLLVGAVCWAVQRFGS